MSNTRTTAWFVSLRRWIPRTTRARTSMEYYPEYYPRAGESPKYAPLNK